MAWQEDSGPPCSLYRLTPDGAVTELFGGVGLSNGLDWTDDRKAFSSAAFGGADLGTLYITTARENFTPADLREQPHAGDIFGCVPGVTGRPPYLFGA